LRLALINIFTLDHVELSLKLSSNEKTSRGRGNPDCLPTNTGGVLENADVPITVKTLYSGEQSKLISTT